MIQKTIRNLGTKKAGVLLYPESFSILVLKKLSSLVATPYYSYLLRLVAHPYGTHPWAYLKRQEASPSLILFVPNLS